MSDIANKPSIDTEKNNAKVELVKKIDEYLKILDDACEEQDIDYWVYFFFEPCNNFERGLREYSNAAAAALYVFATDKKICDRFEKLYEDELYVLCRMLKKLIEFCDNISSNEANLALIDRCKWAMGHNYHHSIQDIIKENIRYTYKSKQLIDSIQINKSML
jgi:hypothetical protein